MLRDINWKPGFATVPRAVLLAVAALASGCSGSSLNGATTAQPPTASTAQLPAATAVPALGNAAPPPSSPSFKDKVASFFSGATQREPQPVTNAQPDFDCPYIDIRRGAGTLTIPPPPPDGANEAMSLKYQGTFVRAARECKVVANQMVMRVGIEGRIIVGPAGAPGQVEVPVRLAVVQSPLTTPKTIITKLVRIPVMVNAQNVSFTYIEEGLTFPMPSAAVLDDYIVYIGFDPFSAAEQDRAKPAAKPKPKAKPNPNTPTG